MEWVKWKDKSPTDENAQYVVYAPGRNKHDMPYYVAAMWSCGMFILPGAAKRKITHWMMLEEPDREKGILRMMFGI